MDSSIGQISIDSANRPFDIVEPNNHASRDLGDQHEPSGSC